MGEHERQDGRRSVRGGTEAGKFLRSAKSTSWLWRLKAVLGGGGLKVVVGTGGWKGTYHRWYVKEADCCCWASC